MKRGGVPLLFICLHACNLLAQAAGDYLISEDPYTYKLPDDIVIQAAWELDSTARLAIWGTVGYNGTNERQNLLVANLNGEQFRLTGSQAIPYQTVGILTLDDRFLVVWNDRRVGGEGLYARVVMPDGRLEEEMFLGSEVVKPVFIASWIIEEGGRVMLWNDVFDGKASAHMLRLDAEGKPQGKIEKIGDAWISSSEIYTMPGGQLFVHLDNKAVIVVTPDGNIDGRTIPAKRLDIPHYHTGDSSLAVLDGTQLHFYQSLYDELPERTVDLTAILSGKYIQVLSRDSIGWFLNHRSTLSIGQTGYKLSHQLYFDPDNVLDTFSTTRQVAVWGVPPQTTHEMYVSGGGGVQYTEINVAYVYSYQTTRYKLPSLPTYFENTEYLSYYIVGKDRFENHFVRPPRPKIGRIQSANLSAVKVIWNQPKDTVELSAAVVPEPYRVNYRLRSIGTSDDTVCVKYDTTAGKVICRCYSELYSTTTDTCVDDLEWREPNPADTLHILTPQGVRIVLGGGPDGVRGTVYDRFYNVLRSDEGVPLRNFRISHGTGETAHPLGFLRHDTLFVIWEDSSTGNGMDLFGTFWKLPKWFRTEGGEVIVVDSTQTPPTLPEIEEEFLAGVRIDGLSPNPTFAEAVITLETRHHEGYVDILFFDLRGREVKRLTFDTRQGKHDYLLSLSGLPEGVYEVRAVTETSIDSERLVLLRKH